MSSSARTSGRMRSIRPRPASRRSSASSGVEAGRAPSRDHGADQRDEHAEHEGREQTAHRQRKPHHQHRAGRRQDADHDHRQQRRPRPTPSTLPTIASAAPGGRRCRAPGARSSPRPAGVRARASAPRPSWPGRCPPGTCPPPTATRPNTSATPTNPAWAEANCAATSAGVSTTNGSASGRSTASICSCGSAHRRGRGRRSGSARARTRPIEGRAWTMMSVAALEGGRPLSATSPTMRSRGMPSRRPEIRSVSPDRARSAPPTMPARARRSASPPRADALRQARPPDRGVDLRIDAEHEQREDALVLAGRGRDREAALGHRRGRNDPGCARIDCTVRGPNPSSANARSRTSAWPSSAAVALSSACSEADPATIVRRHHRDAERDADERQRGAQRARQQAAPGERPEAHRSYSPSAASRRIRRLASWSARRPSTISSRTSPSRTTSTRSA